MEKSQYDLCVEVLRRLDSAGVLKHIVLVGSWCTLFYKSYFGHTRYAPVLKTRDIDLLVPHPSAINVKTNVAELLKDLGFVVGFNVPQGYIRLEHPGLIIEFLTVEKGRPSDKPYPLPKLGLNAQPLRFLEMLASNTITAKVEDLSVTLPHPANFALHKLLISQRRPSPQKAEKDRDAAVLGELACEGTNLVPDLSFGTHFFQDLVETDIFYVAIFPSHKGFAFNEKWFAAQPNQLASLLPDKAKYADVIKVIDLAGGPARILGDVISQQVLCFLP